MFEIDLLTKTGLQKAIQKTNFDKNAKKQRILIYNKDAGQTNNGNNDPSPSDKIKILPVLVISLLAVLFVSFGLFNISSSVKINDFLPKTTTSEITNEYENVLSTIIKVLGNSDNSILLNYLELADDLVIRMNIASTDKIKYLDAHSLFSYKIYKSNFGHKVHLHYPVNNWSSSSYDSELTLTNIIKYYKNDHNVRMQMDNKSIYFVSDKITIIRIFETLMFSGKIVIYPEENSNTYNLVYSY